MRVGFGEKFARASRHVRGAWQTKAEQRQKVSQRNQHFLAKRRSLLLSSVEPSTSARTKARVHASHGGPSRGIATPGRARSEREPTAFGCRARARPACFERPRRRPRPRSPRVGSFATRRVPSPSPRHPPRPTRGSRRAVAAAPHYRREQVHAQWRVYTDVARTCPPAATSRPRAYPGARSPRRRLLRRGRPARAAPQQPRAVPPAEAVRRGREAVRGRGRAEKRHALAPRRGRGGAQPGGVREPRRLRRRLRARRRARRKPRRSGRTTPTTPPLCSTWRRRSARGASTEPPPRS